MKANNSMLLHVEAWVVFIMKRLCLAELEAILVVI